MEALGHVRSRACPGLPGPGPDGPLAVNSGVVSAVDRHARAAWALSWARLLCLMPTEKARLVNIKTSFEPPRKDPSRARCRAVSYLRSHPPPRHLPRQMQPTKALSARPSAEAPGRGPKQHLRSAL